jgi:7-cyano-7-deazaguanine synthase
MEKQKNAIILCSGGIDSVVTAYYVRKRLKYENMKVLFFDYNQKSLIQERKASKKCAEKLNADFVEIELKWLGEISGSLINKKGKVKKLIKKDLKDTKKESENWYVPCRNLIFLSYALAFAESVYIKNKEKSDIFIGFKCEGQESYPDTTPGFVNEINKLSRISCLRDFKIIAPLIKKDKEDIIKLGFQLGINFKETFSCYIGKRQHCGYCLACKLRQAGFYWANLKDPTEYKVKIKDFELKSSNT